MKHLLHRKHWLVIAEPNGSQIPAEVLATYSPGLS
uniref:Uncharacterized protein n=1 Tax=Arundo donax TaxID=35708 RepID=A0A0A9CHS1_ARUDO